MLIRERSVESDAVDILVTYSSVSAVSLAQLKDHANHLPPVEQRELIAFLISRKIERDEDFKQILAHKVDDKEASHWMDLDDLKKRYAE